MFFFDETCWHLYQLKFPFNFLSIIFCTILAFESIALAFTSKINGLGFEDSSVGSADSSGVELRRKSVLSRTSAGFAPASIKGLNSFQHEELLKVEPSLARKFDRVSKVVKPKRNHVSSEFKVSEVPYIDLGEVQPGQVARVNVVVRNNSTEDVQMEIVCRGWSNRFLIA